MVGFVVCNPWWESLLVVFGVIGLLYALGSARKIKKWAGRNFPILVMLAWILWGIAMIDCIVPSAPLLRGGIFKLLTMIATGAIFGKVGLSLTLIVKKQREVRGK